jgi:hypothetical protein
MSISKRMAPLRVWFLLPIVASVACVSLNYSGDAYGSPVRESPSGIAKEHRAPRAIPGLSRSHLFGVSIASTSQLPGIGSLAQKLDRRLNIVNLFDDWTSSFPMNPVQ